MNKDGLGDYKLLYYYYKCKLVAPLCRPKIPRHLLGFHFDRPGV